MQLTGPGAIIVDYDGADWIVTDTAQGIEARTNDPGLVFGIVRGFQGADEATVSGPYSDSGDEDSHA